jgi:hypothetical protein
MILLAAKQATWKHHHHLYVGSGTSTDVPNRRIGGIRGRVLDRRLSTLPHSYFHTLLRDGKPREQGWSVIWQIEGSQKEKDTEVRTYNRFLTYLTEALFHDLLGSWKTA